MMKEARMIFSMTLSTIFILPLPPLPHPLPPLPFLFLHIVTSSPLTGYQSSRGIQSLSSLFQNKHRFLTVIVRLTPMNRLTFVPFPLLCPHFSFRSFSLLSLPPSLPSFFFRSRPLPLFLPPSSSLLLLTPQPSESNFSSLLTQRLAKAPITSGKKREAVVSEATSLLGDAYRGLLREEVGRRLQGDSMYRNHPYFLPSFLPFFLLLLPFHSFTFPLLLPIS